MTTIATHRELIELRNRLRKVSVRTGREEYTFRLPGVSEQENQRLGTLFNSYSRACGCNAGAFLMSMFSAGSLLYYFLITGGTLAAATLQHWLWLAALAATGAMTGKFFGLLHARWKMIRLVDNAISLNSHSTN